MSEDLNPFVNQYCHVCEDVTPHQPESDDQGKCVDCGSLNNL